MKETSTGRQRREDYYRLKAGYLRFKGALFDRSTGLFAFPFYFDRIRSLLQGRETVGLVYLEVSGLELVERRCGWQDSDRVRVRITEELLALRETDLGGEALIACSAVHGNGFLIFLHRTPDGETVCRSALETLSRNIGEQIANRLAAAPAADWTGLIRLESGFSLLRDLPLARFERQVYYAVEQARGPRVDFEDQEQVQRVADLRRILDNGQVETHFQPIVRLETGSIVGYEALSRGPRNSFFETPATLFCYSEQIGASNQLDGVCRARALAEARGLKPGLKLFLNSLPAAIQERFLLGEGLRRSIRESQLSSDSIVLEITERTAITDFGQFGRGVAQLREQGFQVAIDDVGTGYSTLQAISEVRPEFLKVDMSLIRNIDRNLIKRGLVSSLVEMGEKIRACVIAEGIEDEGEKQALMECGVRYGQGYYFAHPAPFFPTVVRSLPRDS
jgi:EAL domain-containing protein (putative c-di-GMP-specific phosphodiesterase class I)